MSRISTTITIGRPIEQVYAYITTPGTWPRWHPSSLGVMGAMDHSLAVGEQVIEEVLVAGRRGRAVWTVVRRDPPRLWVIEGQVIGGGQGTVTYALAPVWEGTRFVRTFSYTVAHPLLRLLDPLLIRPRVVKESAEALRRLKALLEGGAR